MQFVEEPSEFSGDLKNPFDEILSPGEKENLPVKKPANFFHKGLMAVLIFAGVLSGLTIYKVLTRGPGAMPLVYVEIKALSDRGFPVAGAKVEFGGEYRGVTDSFGEWRQYARIDLSQPLSIKISKETPAGRLFGGKTMSVDMPRAKGERRHIKARIRLVPAGRAKRAKAYFDRREKEQGVLEARKVSWDKIAVDVVAPPEGADRYARHYYGRIKNKILPHLESSLKRLKMKMTADADIKLKVQYVPVKGKSGFIRGDISYVKNNKKYQESFLRNFHENPQNTAKDILTVAKAYLPRPYTAYKEEGKWYLLPLKKATGFWGLTSEEILTDGIHFFPLEWDLKQKRLELMVAQESPCQGRKDTCLVRLSTLKDRPPQSGWQKLSLMLQTRPPKGSKIYVAGFEALQKGEMTYEFWGKPGAKMNLSLLRGRDLLLRQKIKPEIGKKAVITLPKGNIASL